ncbi:MULTISPECIES: OmpW/AlkL family protein [unclassified Methylophaga]|jgi:outer membrane protein|uniref:OmpW/AlkL family protein n=1 Tax=unclassified Methylophaga TaxID=2629249 RepID=UPI00259CA655|nr:MULTISPECIES: OmpW family protein [unclassified Methylophaga]|tara:strand:- start:2329 stop:3009 length:681 start_codon:yes stop_codon:yes gene_type:complete
MKTTTLAAALLTTLGLSTVAAPAMAYEAGDWLVRGRVINVNPNDDSGQLYADGAAGGEGVSVNSDTVPELDITYMFHKNWGVELILGYSEHTVKGEKNWSALGDVIDTKVLPPTLTLQYHFMPDSNIRPYIGAGVNYTYFFDEEVAGDVLDTPGSKVKLDSSWGLAAQAGVDVALNDDWFVNFDVKYIDIDTEAHFTNIAGGTIQKAKIHADIDPFVWGIGIGRRF